jgi:hypothetical protein
MSSLEDSIDEFLDDIPDGFDDPTRSLLDATTESSGEPWVEPGYEGSIDYRIRQLSYSSNLLLHACPRKFQLYKLGAGSSVPSPRSQITFAFGHVVGQGIQDTLVGLSPEQVIWRMFLAWDTDLFGSDDKANKSFWSAIIAVKKFSSLKDAGVLKDYELVYYKDKPAVELSFSIVFPDGFRYRGFVDAVLRHRITGKILVLECKTTKSRALNPNKYRNSAQGIGYSIVLDSLFPEWSSYEVLYWVYQSTIGEYTPLPFNKSFLQRALWIRELLLDIETIKMYEEANVYPMRGESCVMYSMETEKESNVWEGDCEYINTCTMNTDFLVKKCSSKNEDKTDYQIVLTLSDLLEAQLSKVES